MTHRAGRHFLQIPGPTNVPDRVLRAMDRPTIDHRGPDFAALGRRALAGLKRVCRTATGEAVLYPASGTGAWEAALVNTLSPGDQVLMYETGHFATLWCKLAARLGLEPILIEGDWRSGADAAAIEARLLADKAHTIKAVCVVQNETSTGCATPVQSIRQALDATGHTALLMVDTISSLASIDMQMDAWGVDVIVGGSQKGLMLPPGLSFNVVSPKALDAHGRARLTRAYWDWSDMLEAEGLDQVFARHARHAEATRRAVQAWGLRILCADARHHSSSLTAILMPEGHSADALRRVILDRFDLSLGAGLSKVADKVFRIGHLGDFNDLMLLGTLAGVEMGLGIADVPHQKGGVAAAMTFLAEDDPRDATGRDAA